MVISETRLLEFINQHAETPKSIEISDMSLWQGSFENLLASLRDTEIFEAFHDWGKLYACHPLTNEHWNTTPEHNIYPDSWTPEFRAFVSKNRHLIRSAIPDEVGTSRKLEDFVLNGGLWPLDPDKSWLEYLHSSA